MDGLKAARVLKQAARSLRRAWFGGALAVLLVVASFTRTSAGVEQTSVEDIGRVRVTVNAPASYDCGFDANGADDALARHRMQALRSSHQRRRLASARPTPADGPRLTDQNDIALIEDDGSIILPPAAYDLKKRAVLFTPEAGGYRITPTDLPFAKDFGTRLRDFLAVDGQPSGSGNGYCAVPLTGAPFTFCGVAYNQIYVGTNGYITFNGGDTSSRLSASALAMSLPRIAPLWASLDMSGGGDIYYNRLEDRHVITWDGLPESAYGSLSTFQAALYNGGRIAFIYRKVNAHAALVGLSPGGSEQDAQPVAMTAPPAGVISGPLFQLFSKQRQLDLSALMRVFYGTHADEVDTAF